MNASRPQRGGLGPNRPWTRSGLGSTADRARRRHRSCHSEDLADADVLVVAPALNSWLRRWLSDEDAARRRAEERLAAVVGQLQASRSARRGSRRRRRSAAGDRGCAADLPGRRDRDRRPAGALESEHVDDLVVARARALRAPHRPCRRVAPDRGLALAAGIDAGRRCLQQTKGQPTPKGSHEELHSTPRLACSAAGAVGGLGSGCDRRRRRHGRDRGRARHAARPPRVQGVASATRRGSSTRSSSTAC